MSASSSSSGRLEQQLGTGVAQPRGVGEDLPKPSPAALPVVEPEHVAGDRAQRRAAHELCLRVRHEVANHLRARARRALVAEHLPVRAREQVRVVVRGAAEHHAVDVCELAVDRRPVADAAVQHDHEFRELGDEPVHDLVAQRRDLAVLLRRESLQHGIARVHDEHLAARCGDRTDEVAHERVVLVRVEADAVLHGDRKRHRVAHRLHAVGDQCGLRHQARAEAAGLHALGGTAAVEIDLVVAPALAELRRVREQARVAAAELQCHRVLRGIEVEVARHVAVRECRRGDHLGVEPCATRDQAQEVPAVAVRPVHHRRDAEAPVAALQGVRFDTAHGPILPGRRREAGAGRGPGWGDPPPRNQPSRAVTCGKPMSRSR